MVLIGYNGLLGQGTGNALLLRWFLLVIFALSGGIFRVLNLVILFTLAARALIFFCLSGAHHWLLAVVQAT